MKLSDEDLMKKIKRGSKEPFSTLVIRYQNGLFQFFFQLGETSEEAEDLVQETFLKLFKTAKLYQNQGKFRSYLYTLARNIWIDNSRKRKDKTLPLETLKNSKTKTLPTSEESFLEIQRALGALSGKLRITIILKFYHHLKYSEISEILSIPIGTVKSRISLAMKDLRKELSECATKKENK